MTANQSIVIGFVLAALCYLAFEFVVRALRWINRRLRTQLQKRKPPAAPGASPPGHSPMPGWYALPGGNRLEYRASGFAIELKPQHSEAPYRLITPEGFTLATGQLLLQLQLIGIHAAGERAQFEPTRKDGAP